MIIMCSTRVLAWKEHTIVSECTECLHINIWHANLLLNFSKSDLLSFKKVIHGLNFWDHSHPFPDGSERIILRTPNSDISFTFEETDFELFKEAVDEAIYMSEVYALMR